MVGVAAGEAAAMLSVRSGCSGIAVADGGGSNGPSTAGLLERSIRPSNATIKTSEAMSTPRLCCLLLGESGDMGILS